MSKFLLSAHTVAGEPREPMTDEQMRLGYEAVGRLEADLRAATPSYSVVAWRPRRRPGSPVRRRGGFG